MENDKHLGLRIDEETLEKFRYVAKYDARSLNGQIMFLIHKCIREFEAEHGKIELPEGDS